MYNSFHRQSVSVYPCKQTKCTYTHWNVDCSLLTHLPAMQVITYYIQTLKQCHWTQFLHSMYTDADFALLTYLLTYLLCYVLGKLFTDVHQIRMCVIVYIAEVMSLSPFDTWLSPHEQEQNVLTHLTYLFTYWLHTWVKMLSLINCLCLHSSYVHWKNATSPTLMQILSYLLSNSCIG